jgi:hypothetical protein
LINSPVAARKNDELQKAFLAQKLERLPQFVAYVPVSREGALKFVFKLIDVLQREFRADIPPFPNHALKF